ncbi:MAG: glycoside hydrolase family 15 protein [Acidimicrobiales bacterium]|nr:glycoside hydrolase family 15 protein [Acidimicrobiales bacterium]
MPSLIEDYALIGDSQTVALVARDGCIGWFCAPRFDSEACFAELLGDARNGFWRIAPVAEHSRIMRRYRGDTLVLETVFDTPTGSVALIDFMPRRSDLPSIVRIVEGRSGSVSMRSEAAIRFGYGDIVPWVRSVPADVSGPGGIDAVGGAHGLTVRSPVSLEGVDRRTMAEFTVSAGQRVPFIATWHESYRSPQPWFDPYEALDETERWWMQWSARCRYDGEYRDAVMRSLITLKALTFEPSGGIVAAPTTSLPERIGGVRNWDYRYCWLRDATFTLNALLDAGYDEEAASWVEWLRRAVAGDPEDMQILYGVAGERRLWESELPWLAGYEGSRPVRIGNEASQQFQLDVFGEVMDMFHTSLTYLGSLPSDAVDLARFLVKHVRGVWRQPDEGIWEVRGPRRHFVHSKVMAWVAVDRWVKIITQLELDEPVRIWADLRDEIHREVCAHGFNRDVGAFTQYYGSSELDASCLMLALVGFLPSSDPRIVGTVESIRRELMEDGFVMRYRTEPVHVGPSGATETIDGLPPGEGAFLLTTFWMVDNLACMGRVDEARAIFERLMELRNDVGLLSEQYDVTTSRFLGNMPQAFSHVGLVNSASNLSEAAVHAVGPLRRRAGHVP